MYMDFVHVYLITYKSVYFMFIRMASDILFEYFELVIMSNIAEMGIYIENT